jgi:PEGA domain
MTCHRLDDDGALAELMEAPDPHTQQCPDCSARLGSYRHIAGWIAEGKTGHRASEEWRRRTLAQLRASASAVSTPPALLRVVPAVAVRGTRRWLAAFAIAAAAIVVVALVAVMAGRDETAVTIAMETNPPAAPPSVPASEPAVAADPSATASADALRTPSSGSPDGAHRRRGATVAIDLPAATIDVSIDTTPPGARVLLNGAVLGTTPYRGTLPRSDRRLELAISRASYVDEVITIDASRPVARRIQLVPIQRDR